MVMSSARLEAKTDCAGEGQQQFTRQTGRLLACQELPCSMDLVTNFNGKLAYIGI
jgi:hypothetical protein